jgi:flavin reductase (DIM6/NTAB) family NADH-FMN oxidoreductase RutF
MCEASGVTNVVIMSQPNLDPSAEHPSRHLGASLSADEFKTLFRGHPGGVAVITADAGDGPVALTATSVSSVSADPPLLVFSVSAQSSASAVLSSAETVVVHLLDADDLALAKLGATSGVDRFADTSSWSRLTTGEPVYRGVRAWVRCAVVSRMDAGGSIVIAGHALQSHVERDVEPGGHGDALVYHNRTWHRLSEHSALAD